MKLVLFFLLSLLFILIVVVFLISFIDNTGNENGYGQDEDNKKT